MKINEVTLGEAFPTELTPGSEQRDGYTSFLGSDGYNYFVANEPNEDGNFYYYRSVVRGGNRMRLKSYEVPSAMQQAVRQAMGQNASPAGSVPPRPNGGHARRIWDQRYGETHNPDGTPKDPDATDPRGDQTAPPPRAETPPAETPPAETPPEETPPEETPPAETPSAETPPESPGESPAPTPGGTPATQDPDAGDGPEPSQSSEPEFTLSGNLRQGSRGDEVRRLQAALNMPQSEQDGIFGPRTAQAVRTFQQNQGLQVDGIVGAQTLAAIQRLRGNPNAPSNVQPGQIQNQSRENKGNALVEGILKNAGLEKKRLDEASISINGADASEVAEILRMMQLAGASGAKVVGADDINPGPKPCPICGKVHGPMPSPGGCGSKPSEPGMGDMIRMISSEEEELDEWENNAPGHEGDAEYMNATDAAYPEGNDMHKKKKSYPATAGGDNPMNTESLESELKSKLTQALAEKKAKPDYIDIDNDGDTEEPMKKAVKDKEETAEGYKIGKFKKRHKQKARFM